MLEETCVLPAYLIINSSIFFSLSLSLFFFFLNQIVNCNSKYRLGKTGQTDLYRYRSCFEIMSVILQSFRGDFVIDLLKLLKSRTKQRFLASFLFFSISKSCKCLYEVFVSAPSTVVRCCEVRQLVCTVAWEVKPGAKSIRLLSSLFVCSVITRSNSAECVQYFY